MNPIRLGVNIDHVATLRQARGTRYPDPLFAALLAEQAGADSITLHLREDRRHIQDHDVARLRDALQTRMNLEMAVTEAMLDLAVRWRPHACCLVPERREELTTEGGLNVAAAIADTRRAVSQLRDAGIVVALFIDPDPRQLDAAVACGAPAVELHTGRYAETESPGDIARELVRIVEAARRGRELGLAVHAGHGLTYQNVTPVAAIAEIEELNIGHAIVAQAVFDGFPAAVARMKELLRDARRG